MLPTKNTDKPMPPFISSESPIPSHDITIENIPFAGTIPAANDVPLYITEFDLPAQHEYFPPVDPSKPDASEIPTFSQWLHLRKLERPWWPALPTDTFRDLYYKLRFNLDLSHQHASQLLCLAPQTVDKWLKGVRPPNTLRMQGLIISIINMLKSPDLARYQLQQSGVLNTPNKPIQPNKPIKAVRDASGPATQDTNTNENGVIEETL